MWKTFISQLSEIFFPKNCVVCKKDGADLCDDCINLCEIFSEQYCPYCSTPQITKNGKSCGHHQNKYLDELYCACDYQNKIANIAIKKFKYGSLQDLSKPLAKMIYLHILAIGKNKNDFKNFIIVAVPITKNKENLRGFNQSLALANALALILEINVMHNGLKKIKETLTQAQLTKNDRKENVLNAFIANGDLVKDKNIILIDDVYTTGSTCQECAKTLKLAGAKTVIAMTVAREHLK
jgi:ComF family protein